MDGDGWGRGVHGEMRNEKRESTTCTCKKSQLAHTHLHTRTHTLAQFASEGMRPYIRTHTHVCVCAYKYMRDPSDMLKICIEN